MGCESTCEVVQVRVESARFLHITLRPWAGSPSDLKQTLLQLVKRELEIGWRAG